MTLNIQNAIRGTKNKHEIFKIENIFSILLKDPFWYLLRPEANIRCVKRA